VSSESPKKNRLLSSPCAIPTPTRVVTANAVATVGETRVSGRPGPVRQHALPGVCRGNRQGVVNRYDAAWEMRGGGQPPENRGNRARTSVGPPARLLGVCVLVVLVCHRVARTIPCPELARVVVGARGKEMPQRVPINVPDIAIVRPGHSTHGIRQAAAQPENTGRGHKGVGRQRGEGTI